jgi:hypothetical protein
MKTTLKVLFLILPTISLVSCSSGKKATKDVTTRETKTTSVPAVANVQPQPAPTTTPSAAPTQNPSTATGGQSTAGVQASPVIVTPNPAMSGSTTAAPMNQDQMQGLMDQCMTLHKDTQVCSQRLVQDCQMGTDATSCQNMMKNVKVLRGQ